MCTETSVERDWVLGSREGALGKVNGGHEEGVWRNSCHSLFLSSLALLKEDTKERSPRSTMSPCRLTSSLSLFYCR